MPAVVKSDGPARSDGEKIVSAFISNNLPDSFEVWMNLELSPVDHDAGIKQMEIDLVLFHMNLGLMLCEIKDWRADQIRDISRQSVTLKSGHQEANPGAALRKKFYDLHTMLSSRPEFSAGKRRVKMPINTLVCFPYISRDDWSDLFQNWRIQPEDVGLPSQMVIFCDDLLPSGALCDENSAVLRLDKARTVKFKVSLSAAAVTALDHVLRGYSSTPVPRLAVLSKSEIRQSVTLL